MRSYIEFLALEVLVARVLNVVITCFNAGPVQYWVDHRNISFQIYRHKIHCGRHHEGPE